MTLLAENKVDTKVWCLHDTHGDHQVWTLIPFKDSLEKPYEDTIGTNDADEAIESLHNRNPAPHGLTRVVVSTLERVNQRVNGDHAWSRRNRYGKSNGCILVLGQPVFTDYSRIIDADTRDRLESLCDAHGEVLVPYDDTDEANEIDGLRDYDFTLGDADLTVSRAKRVKYRPGRGVSREIADQRAKAKELLSGFPENLLGELAALLAPDHWDACDSPYRGVIKGTHTKTTWDRNRRREVIAGIDVQHVVGLIRLGRRLLNKGRTPWREAYSGVDYYRSGRKFVEHLGSILPYIHGVEDQWSKKKLAKLSDGRREYALKHTEDERFLCRWLRREAKIAQVEIPPRPVVPPTASEQKRLEIQKANKKSKRKGVRRATK